MEETIHKKANQGKAWTKKEGLIRSLNMVSGNNMTDRTVLRRLENKIMVTYLLRDGRNGLIKDIIANECLERAKKQSDGTAYSTICSISNRCWKCMYCLLGVCYCWWNFYSRWHHWFRSIYSVACFQEGTNWKTELIWCVDSVCNLYVPSWLLLLPVWYSLCSIYSFWHHIRSSRQCTLLCIITARQHSLLCRALY